MNLVLKLEFMAVQLFINSVDKLFTSHISIGNAIGNVFNVLFIVLDSNFLQLGIIIYI